MLSLDQRPLIGQNRSAGRELSSLRAPRELATGVIYNIIYRHFSANSALAPQIPRIPLAQACPRTSSISAQHQLKVRIGEWMGCRTPNPTFPERRRTPTPGGKCKKRHTAQSLPDAPCMSARRASIYPSTRCHQQVWVGVGLRLRVRVAAWPVRSGVRAQTRTRPPPGPCSQLCALAGPQTPQLHQRQTDPSRAPASFSWGPSFFWDTRTHTHP